MAAKQKFNFDFGKSSDNDSAGEVLKKIETQNFHNYQIIPYEDIEANLMNDYPISDIEELEKEIRQYGLITPLGLIMNSQEDILNGHKKYRLLSGERRYTAIGRILNAEPDYPSFKRGIPSMVEKNIADPVEEEIKMILANKQRDMTEEFRRKKAQRLFKLYSIRKKQTGEKMNITKQIANDLEIGERQVQRYNAVNNKLIPELKEAFDLAKLNLEDAAQISNMDEAFQQTVVQILKANQEISKKELDYIKNENKQLKKDLEEKKAAIKQKDSEIKAIRSDIQKKEEAIKKAKEEEAKLLEEIKKEQSVTSPDLAKITALENQIKDLKMEKEALEESTREYESILCQNEESMKRMEEELKKKATPPVAELSGLEREKIAKQAELFSLQKEIEKKLYEYTISLNSFKEQFKSENNSFDNTKFITKIKGIIQSYDK